MGTDESFWVALQELRDAADEALDTEDWEPVAELAVRAARAASTVADLWRIVDLEPIAEATFGEGSHSPEFLEAIFEKASTWSDSGARAGAIAIGTRLVARDPGRAALADEREADVRPALASMQDRHIGLFRDGLGAGDPIVRTAALHALACCDNTDESDGLELARLLVEDTDEEAVATALLCLGKMAHRVDASGRTIELVRDTLAHPSPLVRACGATARAWHDGRVDSQMAEVFAQAIEVPFALPRAWGWVSYGEPETSVGLSLRVLSWVEVPPGLKSDVIVPLAAYSGSERSSRRYERTLFRIAFGAREELAAMGFALEELDAGQRTALAALRDAEHLTARDFEALGLWHTRDVDPFLSGRGALWLPIDVCVHGVARKWHLARIWREHIWADLEAEEVLRAVFDGGITAAELVDALCRDDADILLARSPSDPARLGRHMTLMARVLERIAASDFDLLGMLAPLIEDDRTWSRKAHALGILYGYAARGERPPSTYESTIAHGLAFWLDHPMVAQLLSSLDDDQRQRIFAAAKAIREE